MALFQLMGLATELSWQTKIIVWLGNRWEVAIYLFLLFSHTLLGSLSLQLIFLPPLWIEEYEVSAQDLFDKMFISRKNDNFVLKPFGLWICFLLCTFCHRNFEVAHNYPCLHMTIFKCSNNIILFIIFALWWSFLHCTDQRYLS